MSAESSSAEAVASSTASTKPVDKAGNALSGLSCDRVERIWRHRCTQVLKKRWIRECGGAAAAKPPRRSRWAGGPREGSESSALCGGWWRELQRERWSKLESRLRCPRGKRGRQAKILSTMHRVHGSEKQVWSREQGNERLTHEWA